MITARTGMESKTGKKASEVSTEMAMTTTLATVPNPGRWRIGIQSSSTTAPVIAVITPKLSETCSATP